MRNKYILGIDVGGTNIKSGLVDYQGRTDFFQSVSTKKEEGPEYVLSQIEGIIEFYKNIIEKDTILAGVGVALPGSVDSSRGICLFSPNLHWENIEVSERLKNSTGLEVNLINDANAACLGEYFFGAGRGCGNLICITIGTGIGCAFILEHKLFVGASGLASEAGHMVIMVDGPPCSCGRKGCLESLISATAIVRRTREKMKAGFPTRINQMIDDKLDLMSTKIIAEAFREGDPLAMEIMLETKKYLAVGLANLVNILNPEKIILGGGVIGAEDILLNGLITKVKEIVYPTFKQPLEILTSGLGNQAGVVGAASLLFKQIKPVSAE